MFYTALYHTLIHPNILNDVNGEYPVMEYTGDANIPENTATARYDTGKPGIGRVEPGHNRYTVFSLWDTYRNVHQLMTLLFPERQLDMVRSMVSMYQEWGWMPKWELYGRETFTMEGDPAIPVIADTWLKGLKDFDINTAYEAFVKSATDTTSANLMRPDNKPYVQLGYIPLWYFAADFSGDNSVSHALEYYVADNALSLLAKDLGKKEDAEPAQKQISELQTLLQQGIRHTASYQLGRHIPDSVQSTAGREFRGGSRIPRGQCLELHVLHSARCGGVRKTYGRK